MNKLETLQPQFQTSLKRSFREIDHEAWRTQDVGINVVFGVSETGLPARFLAGFVPAFSLAEALAVQKQTEPELRVFVPLHLAMECNNISDDHGKEIVRQGVSFVQKFQEIFHPTISWFLDIDQPFTSEATSLLIDLSNEIIHDPHLNQQWHQAFDAARKRGTEENALVYTPHHIFGWQDAKDPNLFFASQPKQITMNCFSKSEEKFQDIRKKLMDVVRVQKPELVVHGQHIDLFTSRCPGPHYIPSEKRGSQEPLLSDLSLTGFKKTRNNLMGLLSDGFHTALNDLESINDHIESKRIDNPKLPDIEEFIQEVNHARK